MTAPGVGAVGSPATTRANPRGFRPEIQALRALGIGLVLLYHVWPQHLSGGFVGVDVFFVISGFLITMHLLSELERRGRIDLVAFYGRRIRRLLPAALLVLALSAVAMYLFLPATLRDQTAREITASALYVQNWILAADSVDYSAAGNVHTLAQHYWSLSVEEQFYLVWPIALIALAALAARIRRFSRRRVLAVGMTAILVASLAFSIVDTAQNPASAYFVTPTRVWEFAIGGLLALVLGSDRGARAIATLPLVVQSVLGWAGLAMVAFAAITYDGATPFPSYRALVPVVGTALVILAGSPATPWSITPVARWRPIQWLGDVSYSVYLWHWPLIVLVPFVFGASITLPVGLAIIAVTLALAQLTKVFVEDPARRWAWLQARRWRSFAAAVGGMALVVALCSGQWVQAAVAQTRYDSAIAGLTDATGCVGANAMLAANTCEEPFALGPGITAAVAKRDRADILECQQNPQGTELVVCERGDTTDPVGTIALVGDSHAEQLMWALDDYAQREHLLLRVITKSSCPVLVESSRFVTPECEQWGAKAVAAVAGDSSIRLVVYSLRSQIYVDPANPGVGLTGEDVAAGLTALAAGGAQLAVVADVPGTNGVTPDCLAAAGDSYDPCTMSRDDVASSAILQDAATAAGAAYIDLTDSFCSADTCHSVIGGLVVYVDAYGHLTSAFSRSLGPTLTAVISGCRKDGTLEWAYADCPPPQ